MYIKSTVMTYDAHSMASDAAVDIAVDDNDFEHSWPMVRGRTGHEVYCND